MKPAATHAPATILPHTQVSNRNTSASKRMASCFTPNFTPPPAGSSSNSACCPNPSDHGSSHYVPNAPPNGGSSSNLFEILLPIQRAVEVEDGIARVQMKHQGR